MNVITAIQLRNFLQRIEDAAHTLPKKREGDGLCTIDAMVARRLGQALDEKFKEIEV